MALPRQADDLPSAPISGAELWKRPDLGPCELVDGRIVRMTPTGYTHGAIEARLAARLLAWAEGPGRGRVLAGEVGIYVRRDPDTVRAADVAFLSEERFVRRSSSGYLDVAPELVAEVLSPEDRWSSVMEKISEYLAAGVSTVWVVDPRTRRVFAYRSPAKATVFEDGQILVDADLFPGFSLPLAELFRD